MENTPPQASPRVIEAGEEISTAVGDKDERAIGVCRGEGVIGRVYGVW